MNKWIKIKGRERRRKIIRKKISGTLERPRLSVYRSLNHFYAQLIDDDAGVTILSLSTIAPGLKEKIKKVSGGVKGSEALGAAIAEACKAKGIKKVVFDRAGYQYHGRVKALAEAARKGGLEF